MSCDILSNLVIKNSRNQTKKKNRQGLPKSQVKETPWAERTMEMWSTEKDQKLKNQGYPELFRKLEAGLGNISLCLK